MKNFKNFLEEAYFFIEKRKYKEDSYGFNRDASPEEKKELKITYDGPREKRDIEQHYKSLGVDVPYEPGLTSIHHKPSGITYEIKHHRPESQNPKAKERPQQYLTGKNKQIHSHKPSHEISWYPPEMDTSHMPIRQRIRIARNAEEIWKKHISHRIPSGSLVTNRPESKSLEQKYRRRGFGNTTPESNKQYSAKIGNRMHPIQRESFEMSEGYKNLPRYRMMMRALKNFNKMRGHSIKSSTVGSDTTEGQIEKHKANKAAKRAATISAVMMSHDRNRSLEQDVNNRIIGLVKKKLKS